jgi:nucleoside-diphosphate-sugar epimerase
VEWIFHLAAMPGLVKSWTHFDEYNTQHYRHATAARSRQGPGPSESLRLRIYSSVYGRFASGDESLPRPSSPYGVTKLAENSAASMPMSSTCPP